MLAQTVTQVPQVIELHTAAVAIFGGIVAAAWALVKIGDRLWFKGRVDVKDVDIGDGFRVDDRDHLHGIARMQENHATELKELRVLVTELTKGVVELSTIHKVELETTKIRYEMLMAQLEAGRKKTN